MLTVARCQVNLKVSSIVAHVSIRIEFVRQCARRSDTRFLAGQHFGVQGTAINLIDLTCSESSVFRWNLFELSLLDCDDELVPVEKVEHRFVGIVGAKNGSEIAGDRSAPSADVFFVDRLAKFVLDE